MTWIEGSRQKVFRSPIQILFEKLCYYQKPIINSTCLEEGEAPTESLTEEEINELVNNLNNEL